MSTSLNGWHRGERAIQAKLSYAGIMATAFAWIQASLDGDDRAFHSSLPFLPITTLDAAGRPWCSVVCAADGKPGFITSPSNKTLLLRVDVWEGDPLLETAKTFGVADKMLVAGIGIDFSSRERSKFAGWVSKLSNKNNAVELEFTVNQAIGCAASNPR